jgi:hypothetical protein
MKHHLYVVLHVFFALGSISFPFEDKCRDACRNGYVLPKLFIIGSQKGGTSSLYADLTSSNDRMVMSTACRNRHDPKECNVFTTHSTLSNLYQSFGNSFCRPGGTTTNYCTRLKGRGFKSSDFFTSQYDSCSAASIEACVNPSSNKSACVPLVPIDASPTYSTRPHVKYIHIYFTHSDIINETNIRFFFYFFIPS